MSEWDRLSGGVPLSEWDRLQAAASKAAKLASAIDRTLSARIGAAPKWSEFGVPVIDRRTHAIFPFAAAQLTDSRDSDDERLIVNLIEYLRLPWGHAYGNQYDLLSHVDSDEGYGSKLAKAGGLNRQAQWWKVQHFGCVFVHSLDASRQFDTLAIHVVPVEWVAYWIPNSDTSRAKSRHRKIMGKLDGASAAWSWPLNDQAVRENSG